MYNVTEYQFCKYLNELPNVKRYNGEFMHQLVWKDETGKIIAIEENSSWSSHVSYKINDERFANIETLNLITDKFNKL